MIQSVCEIFSESSTQVTNSYFFYRIETWHGSWHITLKKIKEEIESINQGKNILNIHLELSFFDSYREQVVGIVLSKSNINNHVVVIIQIIVSKLR